MSGINQQHDEHGIHELQQPYINANPNVFALMAAANNMLPLISLSSLLVLTMLSQPASAAAAYGDDKWEMAGGTWFGEPEGYGTSGGACGYGALDSSGYGNNVAAGSSPLFLNGLGCGACYQVRCIGEELCKEEPVNVVIIDECPGGSFCGNNRTHFDLSGTAFGNMAVDGKASQLRSLSLVQLQYRRVPCSYPGYNLTFQVDAGSNSMWLAFVVKYQAGAGDIRAIHLQEAGESVWKPMVHNWGAGWEYTGLLHGPLSVRITCGTANQVLVAPNSIPDRPQPGATYVSSTVQFSTT